MRKIDCAFLDTNVLIYWADVSAGSKHIRAREILNDPTFLKRISPQVLTEFCRVMVRKAGVPIFSLIPTLVHWETLISFSVEPSFVRDSAMISALHTVSIFDAQIIQAAVLSDCDVLYSEDMHHGFKYKGVEIVNPFQGL